jgi:hypothetical protein
VAAPKRENPTMATAFESPRASGGCTGGKIGVGGGVLKGKKFGIALTAHVGRGCLWQ